MPPLTLDYELEPSELAAAWWKHLPSVRKFRRRLLVIIALLLSLGFLMVLLRGWIWTSFPLGASIAAAFAYGSQKRQLENLAPLQHFANRAHSCHSRREWCSIRNRIRPPLVHVGNYQYFLDASDGLGLVTGGGGVLCWIPTSAFQGQAEREGLLGLARQAGLAPTS